ncbi:MAG: hypothetical protein ACRDG6_13925 [Candidatus Limnocylindria bacterium]
MSAGRREALNLAALAALAVVVLLPNAPVGRVPSEDEGVFLYVARTIASGGMPYRDVWDHKPPGVYLLDVVAGGTPWGVFALQAIALVGAAVLSYRALRSELGAVAAAFGTAAWLLAAPRLFLEDGMQTNFAELFALPFQFAALGLFAAEEKRSVPTWRSATISALGAGAAVLKPTLVGMWIAIAIYLLVTRMRSRRWSDLARRAALLVTPGVLVIALVVAWLARGGALADALDQVVRYNTAYASFASPTDRLAAIALGLRLTLPSGLALLGAAGWLAGAFGSQRPLVLLAVIALPIEILLSSAGRAYHYYFLAWLPTLGVLAGYLAASAPGWFEARKTRWALFAAAALMSIQPGVLVGRLLATPDDGASREAAAYIAASTRPGDTVLVWGSRAEVLVLADRRSPTKLVYQYAALATRGYALPAPAGRGYELPSPEYWMLDEFWQKPPVLIIDASTGSFVTPPFGAESWISPEAQYEWSPEALSMMRGLRQQYERVATLSKSGWSVWRLRFR